MMKLNIDNIDKFDWQNVNYWLNLIKFRSKFTIKILIWLLIHAKQLEKMYTWNLINRTGLINEFIYRCNKV